MSARLFALAALCAAAQAQAGCERFAVPEGARVVIVAKDMVINGVPMAVRELHSKKNPDEIARFYKSEWEGRRQRVQETQALGFRTLSTLDGDCFYTAQIKASSEGSYALLAMTVLSSGPAKARGEGFPKLPGSVVYNDMQSNDSGKIGRTLLMKNSHSAKANAEFYRYTLRQQGWVAVSDQATETLEGVQLVQVWRKGVEETNLTIGGGLGETQVVVNTVDRP